MNHFILTRFNLRLWKRDKHNRETQTEEWLEQRFCLFEKFCLPSVKAQTCADFKWIILMHRMTPESYKCRMRHDVEGMDYVQIVGVRPDVGWYFQQIFSEIINKYRDKEDQRVITTYLDNDDALRLDYVERIQEVSYGVTDKTFIAFAYGLQYYTELNLAVSVRWPNNHFISYVEDVPQGKMPLTVYGYGGHMIIFHLQDKGVNVKVIDDRNECGWLEIVHGTNVDNDVKMRLDVHRVNDSKALQSYGINAEIDPSLAAFIIKFFPRAMKQFVIRLFRKVRRKRMGEH